MPALTTTTPEHDKRIAEMIFADIYPLYVNKIEKKGRTVEELNQVLCWILGFSDDELQEQIDKRSSYAELFEAATLHPNAHMIKGVVCGYRIEELQTKLTREARQMEKLIDELAKGRKMDKILRTEKDYRA